MPIEKSCSCNGTENLLINIVCKRVFSGLYSFVMVVSGSYNE